MSNEDSNYNTIGLQNKTKNDVFEIVKYLQSLFVGKKRKAYISFNDAIAFLLREYKKITFLEKRLNEMQGEYNRKLSIIQKHLRKLELSNGQKILLDLNNIPELNQFVEDEDMVAIKKINQDKEI